MGPENARKARKRARLPSPRTVTNQLTRAYPMQHSAPLIAPPAYVTLRAHSPAPARVELVYRGAAGRFLRAALSLVLCWGAIPFIFRVPLHYPWLATAFIAGAFLAYRSWTGRYRVRSFAGICPRCGSPLSLGSDRIVDLPHTLTCYSCHFEPCLEVALDTPGGATAAGPVAGALVHRTADCVGEWRVGWLADEAFLLCDECHGGALASEATRSQALLEKAAGDLLRQLTDEGKPLI